MGGCPPLPQSTVDPVDVEKLKKSNKSLTKQVKMMMRLFRSDDKFSQMLDQFESSPEFGGANGNGGCGDDEPGGDEDEEDDDKRPTKSLGKVVRERIPGELSPSTYLGRHVARDWFPIDMSPGKCSKCRWG
ncbi:hypothetical protein Tco_1375117 [Tanacetum coccineum]